MHTILKIKVEIREIENDDSGKKGISSLSRVSQLTIYDLAANMDSLKNIDIS